MKKMDTEQEYVDIACARLSSHGLDVERVFHGASGAGKLTISWLGRRQHFAPQIYRGLRPSTATRVLEQQAGNEPLLPLVITEKIAGGMANLLRQKGVNYVDLAGNMYLRSPDFLIDVQGQKDQIAPPKEPRGLTKTDLRVALALIARPQLIGATTRQISECVGISHGGAHASIIKLTGQGLLSPRGLRHGARLMDEWTQAYLSRSGAYKTSRTLYVASGVNIAERFAGVEDVQLSGEIAAQTLGWPIRATSAIVYGSNFAAVARHLRGRSDGGDIPVEIRTPILAPSDNPGGVAASLLIRADMLASGDPRQIEIAQEGMDRDENLRRLQQIA